MKRMSLSVMLIVLALAGWMGSNTIMNVEFVYGGGALGAGTGAIIGAAAGNTVAGAAIGGPVGAIAGYLIGESLRRALDSNVAKQGRSESSVEADSENTEVARR